MRSAGRAVEPVGGRETAPDLVDKIRDLVGLYINPPDAAAVFAVDEKPQIQALDRTAPTLPMLPTTPQRATHDYQRNGTVDLFAALDIARGTVISDIRISHNQDDFIAFLNKINREVPAELDVHIILDNLSTRKTPKVQRWLLRHRRFHLPFTPTYGSWMNLVERWFLALTTKNIVRVLVLGAGFGGLELSTTLSDQLGDDVEVTLIDKAEGFVFGFSKLDVMFGRRTAATVLHPYADIVKPGVRFVQSAIRARSIPRHGGWRPMPARSRAM